MQTTRASLIARLSDLSNEPSWEEFDAIYRPLLRRFARSLGLTGEHLEDIVQQCLSSVARHISRFNYDPDHCRFRTWLYRIVLNQARNHQRKRSDILLSGTDFRNLVSPMPSPEKTFERMWFQQHLEHCLKKLAEDVQPTTYRAYRLYVLEDRPAETVCHELGLSRDQLYRLKWRLTRKLQEHMHYLLGDESDHWLSE